MMALGLLIEAKGADIQTNATPAKTFRLAGTAVDADGKPLADAEVECWQYPGAGLRTAHTEMEVKQHLTSGTNGAFEFRVPPVSTVLVGRKQGVAPAWVQYWNLSKDITDVRLVFTPPTTLTGVVVDEAGNPVADAEVWVSYACIVREKEEGGVSYAYLNGNPTREYFSTRTVADGKFVIQGFPTNASADLAVSKPGKFLREPEREGISPDNMRCQPGLRDVKLVVEPAGSIEGKVVAKETGQPLSGMGLLPQSTRRVNFGIAEHKPAESGADGTFRLADLAPGSYQLLATFGSNQPPEWVAETVSVTVESGQAARDIQVSATRGGFLEVIVLGKEDRKGINGASINAYQQNYQRGVSAGTNGLALLRLPPGEYKVSAYWGNSRSEGSDATVEAGRTNHMEIELNPPPKIVGVVSDPSGAAVPELELSVFPNWGQSGGGAKTDAKGRYEMPWNPQRFGPGGGRSCLLARDVARNLAVAQDIEESTTTLDLRLEPGLVVVGRVEDVKGKPLTNATVQTLLWAGSSGMQFEDRPARTDAEGHFKTSCMPPGRKYTLWVNAKGYGSVNCEVHEDAGTNLVEVEPCVLKVADRKLAGEVVGVDEKPASQVSVHMSGQGQPNNSTRTDDQGRFRFNAVCEGTVRLFANSGSANGNTQAEAGSTNVVIRLGVRESYGVRQAPKRLSLKGKPLPDLAAVELGDEAVPAGKPALLCLFDIEQRPSRRFVKQLVEQYDALKQKGITVLGLQAAVTSAESFKEWKGANPVPFPVGRVAEKTDKIEWASQAESLPWLILTDADRRVTAEGFALDELEAKLKWQTKP
jgi:protocatechuate 3,4-dioxygenase beta subunit